MTKNPLFNALLTLGYIACIGLFLTYATQFAGEEDTVLIPVAMLSLFVFSVALTGYLMLWEPIRLYMEGAKEAALSFFLKTLLSFGGIVVLLFAILFALPFFLN